MEPNNGAWMSFDSGLPSQHSASVQEGNPFDDQLGEVTVTGSTAIQTRAFDPFEAAQQQEQQVGALQLEPGLLSESPTRVSCFCKLLRWCLCTSIDKK